MASIKITLTDSEFSELRARSKRAGIAFSVFAKLCYSAGWVTPYKGLDTLEYPAIKRKVTPVVNLKNAGKTNKIKGKK